MHSDYYVYAHLDRKGLVRYVGKGRRLRAWSFLQRSKLWSNTFSQHKPKVEILESNLDEWSAFTREAFYISKFLEQKMPLLNIACGGPSGWDKRACEILSQMRAGNNSYWFGKNRDSEMIERMKETKRKNPQKPYWKGKKRDPELIKKLADAAHTPEANKRREEKKALGDYLENGKTYKSAKHAADDLNNGIGQRVINACCNGRKRSYKGFHFEYET